MFKAATELIFDKEIFYIESDIVADKRTLWADSMESQDMAGALPNISALPRPQSFGSNFPNQVSSRSSVYSALSDTPSRLSYQMAAINPFSKKVNKKGPKI